MAVRLKHLTRQNDWTLYFYDGLAKVHDGVVEVDTETRLRRAWLMGFRLHEDGQPISQDEFMKMLAQASADSQEEQVSESFDFGRQPRINNRVRESESSGSRDTTDSRPRGRVRSGPRTQKRPAGAIA